MTMETKETIRDSFEHYTNEYLRLFCEKHDFDFEDAKKSWVGERVGGIACCGDFFFDMETIRTDIDTDAPEEELLRWYDYTIETGYHGLPGCNFDAWLRGCPRIPEERLEEIRAAQQKVQEAKDMLKRLVEEEKERRF